MIDVAGLRWARTSVVSGGGVPAVEDEGGVAVVGDEFGVDGLGELAGDGEALGGVERVAVGAGACELPEMEVGGVGLDGSPADGRDALETAVEEDGLGEGVVEAVVVGEAGDDGGAGTAGGDEGAVEKDIAVAGVGVADPHEGAGGADLAVAEERGADAEDGVAVAGDGAVGEVDGAAEVEGVA